MEEWIFQIAGHAPFLIIVGILLLSGFGLPLPEDVPLIAAGYLCGIGQANPWTLFPACFLAIVGADAMVYALGRRYGHHAQRLPLLRRYLTDQRLARTEQLLHAHGGKFIFFARFLPGLRTPAFFTAGAFKLPAWKFVVYDGSAALLSVPVILGLAYYFADRIHWIAEEIKQGQIGALILVAVVGGSFVGIKLLLHRRRRQRERAALATSKP